MSDYPSKKAIALQYNPEKHSAPLIVAKGAGKVAEKIIEQANVHDVQIKEDKNLIQMLYQLEVNEQIPTELYPIVAEVFALIYKAELLAGKVKHEG